MDSLCHRRAGRAGSARDGHRQDVEPGRCLRDLLLLRAVFVLELLQQALRLRPQPRSDGGDQSGAVHAAPHRQAGGRQLHGDKLSGRGVVRAGGVRVAVVDGDLSFEKGGSGGIAMRAGQKQELDPVSPPHRRGAENAEETQRRAGKRESRKVENKPPLLSLAVTLRRLSAPPLRPLRLCGAMASWSTLLSFLAIALFAIAPKAEILTVGP